MGIAATALLISAMVVYVAFFVKRDSDVDGTGFVNVCAPGGLNLGVSRLSTTYLRNADLAKVCGRDTTFDASVRKCIPRDKPVCDIDLSTPAWRAFPEMLRNGECQQRGCSFDRVANRCDTRLECTNAVREEWCNQNPNCAWLGGTICRYRSNPELVLRTGCTADSERVPAASLCGPGTHFHDKRQTCEADEKKL